MTKPNNKSTEIETDHYRTDKRSLVTGGVVVFFITLSPFIFYSYKSFPDLKVWETSFFTASTNFYSWFDFAWYFVGKFVPLYLLLFWFFTCKHWWHWILIIPMAMYAFQLWGVINENKGLDELELYYIIPLMLIIVPFVYLIRAKLFAKVHGNNLKTFEEELGSKQTFFQQIKDLFR